MLSVIIPTLNESQSLPATVAHAIRAARGAAIELIVSDCASRDGTGALARELGLPVISGGCCRADALNRGAAAAHGEVLLFLHADSLLPDRFAQLIDDALSRPAFVGGAFDFEFIPSCADRFAAHSLQWVVLVNRIRFRWTGNFYGDQGIFVRRDIFERIGGFPRVRLMEDIGFCRRMRRFGPTAILRPPILTSPRRFLDRGVVRQFVQDLTLLGYGSLGVRPQQLWETYNAWNHRGGTSVTRSPLLVTRHSLPAARRATSG